VSPPSLDNAANFVVDAANPTAADNANQSLPSMASKDGVADGCYPIPMHPEALPFAITWTRII
jgi:hypothetical protein